MRKPESLFSLVVEFINNVPVDSTYRSSDLCQHTSGVEEVTRWKRFNNNPSYRTRTYQSYLRHAGFVQNVSRGVWKVVKHIPEWLDLGHLNYILGYTKWDYEKNEKVLQYDGMTREQMKQRLEMESQAVNKQVYRGPGLDEAITTFDCIDPLKACIDLRRMGIIAVPVDEGTIEIHAMHKDCGEDLANWMYNNGFKLEDYPELDHYIEVYWPEQEEDDHDCDCDKVFVVVLDYTSGKTYIHQGIAEDEVEDFIESEYSGLQVEWMTMDKLNLEIL